MKNAREEDRLNGKTLYIPPMCAGTVELFCGAMRALGVDARPSPASDERTRELAARHCTGDECYPQLVTLGDFLKVTEAPSFEPARTALFIPKTGGPCRFGQYNELVRTVLDKNGFADVAIISPTCENGYRDLGKNGPEMMHYAWWAIVAGDLLRKALLRTRPYELEKGTTDAVYQRCVNEMAEVLARPDRLGRVKFSDLKKGLRECRNRFAQIAANYREERLLVGISGEIFCRLNTFSNDDMARKIEQYGGEAWVADMSEWIYYSNYWEMEEIRTFANPVSLKMLGAWLSNRVQQRNEHELSGLFASMLVGWEEPHDIREIVERGAKYLDPHAGMGEMILNLGKASWLHEKGADGMVDISPFSCMNGIISQSIYPKVSQDLDGLPIRSFYFDGTQTNLDEDVGIFMELAANYSRNKRYPRALPGYFNSPGHNRNAA